MVADLSALVAFVADQAVCKSGRLRLPAFTVLPTELLDETGFETAQVPHSPHKLLSANVVLVFVGIIGIQKTHKLYVTHI